MEGSVLVHELRKVIKIVDLLRDIGLDKQLSLPKVVVLGNQSSGKSSLLEQIVGLDFLPRGSGVVTRRPLELRMNNIPDLKKPYAQFDEVMQGGGKKRFTDFSQVRKTIDQVTDKVCGSKKIIKDIPIVLNIFSSSCPNLTMVDLPGITSIPVGDQPKNIQQITRDMAFRYIKQKRSIILCVIPANQDLSTSEALKTMRDIDPNGQRSIGCLTKIDIMNRGDDATKILKNQEIPLRYGYVGIKNRSQEDVLNNVPVSDSIKAQRQFFTKSPIYSTLPPDTFGTQSLTKKLTSILYQQIKGSMPQIFQQIKKKKAQSQEQLEKLGPGVANTDGQLVNYAWKSISNFMRIFTNSINGIKNNDYDADPISAEIREELTNLYKQHFDNQATQQLRNKDIERAMTNFPGDSTIPGFPSVDAFLALLNPLLKKLATPAYSCNNRVHQIMDSQASKIINEVMIKKYPEFNSRFNDMVAKVLEKHRKDLQNYLNMLLDAELNYLYTNDVLYLKGDFALTDKQRKKMNEGKIRDPLVFQLRKRIDSYHKLVVRNLRDLVPRQIFNFLISKCLKQLEFEAFQFTSDVGKLKDLLNEPAQIKKRRQQCLHAIKVFQESEKRIRMDPDIAKLIRNTEKQSKYYQKFGIKSLEEQEKQAEQAYRKSMIMQPSQRKPTHGGSSGQGGQSSQSSGSKPQRLAQNTSQPKQTEQPKGNTSSSQSSSSTQSGKSSSKPDMFSMFGTNVNDGKQQPAQQSQPKQNTQPNPNQQMPKQGNPGTGMSSPQQTKPPQNKQFSDLWGEANSKPSQPQQQQPKPQNPPPPPPKKQQPKQGQKSNRSATFNQLFGLK